MKANKIIACATSHGTAVHRLQAYIVKVTQARQCGTVSCKGRNKGLSRMRGNSHVRFLGGRRAEMPSSYPTLAAVLYSISLAIIYKK